MDKDKLTPEQVAKLQGHLRQMRELEQALLETLKGVDRPETACAALTMVLVTITLTMDLPKDKVIKSFELSYDRIAKTIGNKLKDIP